MMTKYAINICDLSELPKVSLIGPVLLRDFISSTPYHVNAVKGYVDGDAVVLDGPAAQDEKRVTSLIELLQTVIGPRKIGRRIRCYKQGERGGWAEIRPKRGEKHEDENG